MMRSQRNINLEKRAGKEIHVLQRDFHLKQILLAFLIHDTIQSGKRIRFLLLFWGAGRMSSKVFSRNLLTHYLCLIIVQFIHLRGLFVAFFTSV